MPSRKFKMGHATVDPDPPVKIQTCTPFERQIQIDPQFACVHMADVARPRDALSPLLDFGTTLASTECANCQCRPFCNEARARQIIQEMIQFDTMPQQLWCRCCRTFTCLGCHDILSTSLSQDGFSTCSCAEGRLYCIWIWLCGLEMAKHQRQGSKDKGSPDQPRSPEASAHKFARVSQRGNGTGYGGNRSTDSASSVHDTRNEALIAVYQQRMIIEPDKAAIYSEKIEALRRRQAPKPIKENAEQKLLPRFFAALADLLPKDSTVAVSPALVCMLTLGPAMEAIVGLLRTNSFSEMIANHETYKSLLDTIDKIVRHPELAHLITGPRKIYSPGLFTMTTSVTEPDFEVVTPVHEVLAKLYRSTQKLRRASGSMAGEFADESGRRLFELCDHVAKVQLVVQERIQPHTSVTTMDSNQNEGPFSAVKQMVMWHREHCIEAVEDTAFESSFHLSSKNPRLNNIRRKQQEAHEIQPVKGRMKRILMEISSLQEALPEGIFVRYGSSRPDLMKVLIIGPRDTPYQQGLFEFDMTLPPNYPQAPPSMTFRTTGHGTAAFNPNLYSNGKVCLSLLGTWNGPSWNAAESTLLQVLVSIQAMVFCAEPWYNEPGRERFESSMKSRRHNIEIQILTMRWALTHHLQTLTERRHGEISQLRNYFADVMEKHFEVHGGAILEDLKLWDFTAREYRKDELESLKPKKPAMREKGAGEDDAWPPVNVGVSSSSFNIFPEDLDDGLDMEYLDGLDAEYLSPSFMPDSFSSFSEVVAKQQAKKQSSTTYVPHSFWTSSPAKKLVGTKLHGLSIQYKSPLMTYPSDPNNGSTSNHVHYPYPVADARLPIPLQDKLTQIALIIHPLPLVVPADVGNSGAPPLISEWMSQKYDEAFWTGVADNLPAAVSTTVNTYGNDMYTTNADSTSFMKSFGPPSTSVNGTSAPYSDSVSFGTPTAMAQAFSNPIYPSFFPPPLPITPDPVDGHPWAKGFGLPPDPPTLNTSFPKIVCKTAMHSQVQSHMHSAIPLNTYAFPAQSWTQMPKATKILPDTSLYSAAVPTPGVFKAAAESSSSSANTPTSGAVAVAQFKPLDPVARLLEPPDPKLYETEALPGDLHIWAQGRIKELKKLQDLGYSKLRLADGTKRDITDVQEWAIDMVDKHPMSCRLSLEEVLHHIDRDEHPGLHGTLNGRKLVKQLTLKKYVEEYERALKQWRALVGPVSKDPLEIESHMDSGMSLEGGFDPFADY